MVDRVEEARECGGSDLWEVEEVEEEEVEEVEEGMRRRRGR